MDPWKLLLVIKKDSIKIHTVDLFLNIHFQEVSVEIL